jgi:CheY-like chemotaxis protein
MSTPVTIIIADRDPIFSNSLRVAFSEMGFTVLLPVDGPDARMFAAATQAVLVVLDVGLPGISAYDACAHIRREPGYRDTPIVLTALQVTENMRLAAATAGATAMLAKPYSLTDLLDSVVPTLAVDHPLLSHRPPPRDLRETPWGPPRPLDWPQNDASGLARNKAVMAVVRANGVRIPLLRRP